MNRIFRKSRKPIILSIAFERPFSNYTEQDSVVMDQRRVCYGVLSDPINLITEHLDATPLIIPTNAPCDQIRHLVKMADGVLLPGGDSHVHPRLYKSKPCPKSKQNYDKNRDCLEIAMLDHAYALKKPVLGICRGMQMINVWRGGTLKQSLSDGAVDHMCSVEDLGRSDAPEHNHMIDIPNGTMLSQWADRTVQTHVNSWHCQAVDTLGQDLVLEAQAPDDIIEAFRLNDKKRFIYGVQWHPDFNPNQPASQAVLGAFKQVL